ncbi:MAG: DNA repair protein RecO C-terminal domain-containing protein [Pseudomonadota bacterium]|nr:DNA repair protein RecO C-terminal domain-containing protein [Pseudomonadota bacterium]
MAALFVLQRQPLRENEWLLDIFSASDGRLHVVAGRRQPAPDLLQEYQGDWRPDEDWPRIRGLSVMAGAPLNGSFLYCGLYLTELLARLLPRYESLPDVYALYRETLLALARGEEAEPWLRLFEVRLLAALGYGFSWHKDTAGQDILPHACYRFIPRQGFVPADRGFSGSHLQAFARSERDYPRSWQVAKQVMRLALDDLLERPLISRELFIRQPPSGG